MTPPAGHALDLSEPTVPGSHSQPNPPPRKARGPSLRNGAAPEAPGAPLTAPCHVPPSSQEKRCIFRRASVSLKEP